ncbi:MAG: GNAT family N-acetyltransferase [Acidimicrobiales bacterium]
MDDGDLATRSDENYFDCMARLAEAVTDQPATRQPGLLLASCRSPISLFNTAFLTGGGDPAELIDQTRAFFEREGVSFVLRSRVGVHANLERTAEANGLSKVDELPGMALAGIPAPPAPPAGFELRAVTDKAGLATHVGVLAPAFGITAALAEHLFSARLLDSPGTTAFVGFVDGAPVATSLVHLTGDTAGVYNVATALDRRKRGYGEAATWGALEAGRQVGATVGVLQASSMGLPIYERMGFRLVAPYEQYVSD